MSLPVGKYEARAISAELGFAETGTELVAVQFEVVDQNEHHGTKVTWRGYFTEKTSRRAIESLKYAGWTGDWETWAGLGSTVVQLDVQEDRDFKTGEVRGTRVAWVNPARMPMKNAMDRGQRAGLAARLKGLVSEVMSSSGTDHRGQSGAAGASGSARPVGPSRATGARVWSSGGGNSAGGHGGTGDDGIPF